MTPKTLKALKSSIASYEKKLAAFEGATKVVQRTNVTATLNNGKLLLFGLTQCPLCKRYGSFPSYCEGCPIAKSPGFKNCRRTPYSKIEKLLAKKRPHSINLLELKQAVSAELDFLKSLLPEGEK